MKGEVIMLVLDDLEVDGAVKVKEGIKDETGRPISGQVLSQAEFDALSEEAKNHGLYFITD